MIELNNVCRLATVGTVLLIVTEASKLRELVLLEHPVLFLLARFKV